MAEDFRDFRRRLIRLARGRTREEPVILLEGPRSVGKSTLMRALAGEFNTQVLDFDDPVVRDDAERDPDFYARPGPGGDSAGAVPILMDEYQRVPAILDAIKARMNRSSRPGQFVIAGSTRHDAHSGSVQALTGRLHRMMILPLAQSELENTAPDVVGRILSGPDDLVDEKRNSPSAETREGYVSRIARGGFPLAVFRAGAARSRWFDDYVRQTIERDIPGIAKIRNKRGLSTLLRKLAAQTGQILALEKTAAAAALDIATARDYIQLLQDVFMVQELPAWGRTLGSRVAAKPKIHILDSGMAARLLGLTPEKLGAREPAALTEFGHLLETFAVSEIQKEISWLDDTVICGHWHTHDDREVDFVVERMDGSVYGFEIKTSGRAIGSDFDGLVALRKFAGDSFRAGFVFYTGTRAFRQDDRLFALPISALWE